MNSKINWDALGIATSVACAIHCAILPLLLVSLPIFGVNIIENARFEYGMIGLAFGIGSWSLWHGYRKHHFSPRPLLLFSAGMALLLAKQAWHAWQFWLLPPAVVLIITAHLVNLRACRAAADQGDPVREGEKGVRI